MLAPGCATVRGSLSFAGDRANGGIWSNGLPHLATQTLSAHEVELSDAGQFAVKPALDREGFVHLTDQVSGPVWADRVWDRDVYLPRCVELVKNVTGAAHVIAQGSSMLRDTGDPKAMPAAAFVHLDKNREAAEKMIEDFDELDTRRRFPRVRIYNLWRAITPPPQDVPLAICDRRSLETSDLVEGLTIEESHPHGVPYLTSVYNAAQRWYYYPELGPGEALLFQQYDNNPTEPMGCLHGAFRHPVSREGMVPRASIESRFIAFFAS